MEGQSKQLRLTQSVYEAIYFGQEQSVNLGQPVFDSEHLLLGLIHRPEFAVAQVLDGLGVTREAIRAMLVPQLPTGTQRVKGDLELSDRCRQASRVAFAAVREFQHQAVGTPHLLLGILDDREGLAGQTLIKLGLTQDALRAAIRTLRLTDSEGIPEQPEGC